MGFTDSGREIGEGVRQDGGRVNFFDVHAPGSAGYGV
jgi:hypothetical protein